MNVKIIAIIGAVIIAILALLIALSPSNDDIQLSSNQWGEVSGEDQIFFIEAIDFECPACASYHPLMKQLREDYSDRIVFVTRHYPLRSIHQNAGYAHRAAEAAAKQDKFWELHDLLFEQRELWVNQQGVRVDPIPAVEQFAGEIGLDWEQLQIDLKSKEVNDIINGDIAWVQKYAPDPATPAFFIQRGVGGPVEFIPSNSIRGYEDATNLFDSLLGDNQPTTEDPAEDEAEAEIETPPGDEEPLAQPTN